MDRELEIRRRSHIPIQALCTRPSRRTRWTTSLVRDHSMDQASPTFTERFPQTDQRRTPRAGRNRTTSEPEFHHDYLAYCYSHWHVVRQITALPVLCVHCMDYSVSPLESWFPSRHSVCVVGCAGMGLERVSEHTYKLGDCSRSPGHYHLWRMVGDEK